MGRGLRTDRGKAVHNDGFGEDGGDGGDSHAPQCFRRSGSQGSGRFFTAWLLRPKQPGSDYSLSRQTNGAGRQRFATIRPRPNGRSPGCARSWLLSIWKERKEAASKRSFGNWPISGKCCWWSAAGERMGPKRFGHVNWESGSICQVFVTPAPSGCCAATHAASFLNELKPHSGTSRRRLSIIIWHGIRISRNIIRGIYP